MLTIFTFSRFYFCLFIVFFIIEVLIALFVKDAFIRPYLGDTFVVILIYSFVRSCLNIPTSLTVVTVLLFSYSVEVMQYFNLVLE